MKAVLFLNFLLFTFSGQAKLQNMTYEGYIRSFDKNKVIVEMVNGKKISLPRDLFLDKLKTNEFTRIEVSESEQKAIEALNK